MVYFNTPDSCVWSLHWPTIPSSSKFFLVPISTKNRPSCSTCPRLQKKMKEKNVWKRAPLENFAGRKCHSQLRRFCALLVSSAVRERMTLPLNSQSLFSKEACDPVEDNDFFMKEASNTRYRRDCSFPGSTVLKWRLVRTKLWQKVMSRFPNRFRHRLRPRFKLTRRSRQVLTISLS